MVRYCGKCHSRFFDNAESQNVVAFHKKKCPDIVFSEIPIADGYMPSKRTRKYVINKEEMLRRYV